MENYTAYKALVKTLENDALLAYSDGDYVRHYMLVDELTHIWEKAEEKGWI